VGARRIIGIDPGSRLCGWGIVDSYSNRLSLVDAGIIDLRSIPDTPDRLTVIFDDLQTVINKHNPMIGAIETPFFHKNAQTLIKLSQARAAAVLAIKKLGLPLAEFSPLEIKKSLTGKGRADKAQVAYMVGKILSADITNLNNDATDALAIAVCRSFKEQGTQDTNRKTNRVSWETFIKENPERIHKKSI